MIVRALGAQTLVQDAGRHGYAHLGVPTAGAFDQFSWRLGNRLVGNPDECASLECLGGGLVLEATAHVTVAVTGAAAPVVVAGRSRSTDEPLHLAPGDRLTLGTPRSGLRYYVAIAGGWVVKPTLGSQSRDTLGQLGPTVRIGDHLSIGPRRGDVTVDHAPPRPGRLSFDVTPGPDLDLTALLEREWDLDPQSNRIGVRLTGDPIFTAITNLPSRPMVLGAVQLPPNGLPIILGPDHPTTGGYPVIAVVTGRSMSDVAQWSGGPRHFRRAR